LPKIFWSPSDKECFCKANIVCQTTIQTSHPFFGKQNLFLSLRNCSAGWLLFCSARSSQHSSNFCKGLSLLVSCLLSGYRQQMSRWAIYNWKTRNEHELRFMSSFDDNTNTCKLFPQWKHIYALEWWSSEYGKHVYRQKLRISEQPNTTLKLRSTGAIENCCNIRCVTAGDITFTTSTSLKRFLATKFDLPWLSLISCNSTSRDSTCMRKPQPTQSNPSISTLLPASIPVINLLFWVLVDLLIFCWSVQRRIHISTARASPQKVIETLPSKTNSHTSTRSW